MPGMSGLETLREIASCCPDALVVLMTAYSELDIIEAKKRGQVLYKQTFDLYEVRCLVRGLLLAEKPDVEGYGQARCVGPAYYRRNRDIVSILGTFYL